MNQRLPPPTVEKIPKMLSIHGDTRIDDYYWLNEKENSKVLDYLNNENAYLEEIMQGTNDLRDQLFSEMKARIKEQDESVPVFKNGYYYYLRFEEGMQYYKYCRKKENLDALEQVVLDVDQMAIGHSYYAVSGFNISPDNNFIAFAIDNVGRRQYSIYIKNLATGETYSDKLFPSSGNSVWANNNQTLYYTETNPHTLLTQKIKRHILGEESLQDTTVYEEADKTNYLGVRKTRSGKFIVIHSTATLSSENWILDADQPGISFKLFQKRAKDVLYAVDHFSDHFIIMTNWEAVNFRLMKTTLTNTKQENWVEMIGHREDVLLQAADPFLNHLVITERKNGLVHFHIRNVQNGTSHYLEFPQPAYSASFGANPEYKTSNLRFNYTSLTTPATTYDYDMETRVKNMMKRQEILGNFEEDKYITDRLFATVRDGTQVPLSIVYKTGFRKDGSAPLLLYGYGSYGLSLDASFSAARLSLLNRGFAFAIAHVRGGQEMGRRWYEDGKLMKKMNTFNDFIDCAEYLLKEKFTSKQHLYAMGGSAGGLLMGVVAGLRPDLWNGVIASVPFVDVVTTMLDESIPLTTNEFDEWGNPMQPEFYEFMKSYSPYDNVATGYPNMLVTTGLHDSQVQYFEPAKWVAKIRAQKRDKNILLFHINMDAGHGGA
ncbi:MAG: S9 family peptidase, partial [Chitinophagaceae bacterium]